MPRNLIYLRISLLAFLGSFFYSQQVQANCGFTIEAFLTSDASCGGSDASAEPIVSAGALAPLSFAWSNGQAGALATGLAAGRYNLTVTDANACEAIASVLIQDAGAPRLNSSTTSPSSCQSLSGSVDFNLTGNAPYDISWTGAATGSLSGQGNTPAITGLDAGNYLFVFTDINGCSLVEELEIARSGAITMTSSVVQQASCAGGTDGIIRGSATLGSLPFEFFLNGVSVGTFFNSNNDFTNLSAGVYTIEIRDANGCRASEQVILTEQGSTPIDIADFAIQDASCPAANSGSIIENVPSARAYEVFNLSNNTVVGPLPQNNLSGGEYQVRLTTAGCLSLAPFTIEEPDAWQLQLQSENPSCTPGQAFIEVSVAGASPGYSYNWSNGATTARNENIFPGLYTITITDAASCPLVLSNLRVENCSSSDTIRVLLGDNTNYCADSTDIFGNIGTVIDLCPGSITNGTASALGTDGCFSYTAGTTIGIDSICIELCNVAGDFCDTTTVVILVQAPTDTLRAGLSTNSTASLCPDNSRLPGTIQSVTNLACSPLTVGSIANLNPADGCLDYASGAVMGNDTICIEVCDNQGFCDTTIFIFETRSPIDTADFDVSTNTTGTFCPNISIFPGTIQSVNDLACSPLSGGNLAGIDFTTGCVSYAAGPTLGRGDTICIEICDNLGFCDTTVIALNRVPIPDTATIDILAGEPGVDSCLFGIQSTGTITAISDLNCMSNLVGTYTLDISTGCVSYTPPSSSPGSGVRADTICVEFCDNDNPPYCDTAVFIFRNIEPDCSTPVVPAQLSAQGAQCSDLRVCLPIPLDSFPFYSLEVDGQPYSGPPVSGCDLVTRIQYPFVLIPGCANDYVVTWQIDGQSFGPAQVSDIPAIIAQMNTWDNNSTWQLDGNVALGINAGNDNLVYGNLSVQCLGGGSPTLLGATTQQQFARGTSIGFSSPGTYELFTTGPLGCIDTTELIILCAAPSEVFDTIVLDSSGRSCDIDLSEVGTVHTISNACPRSNPLVDFTIDGLTGCVSYQSLGNGIGTDTACIIVCDTTGAGVCDTTYLIITVEFEAPRAVRDSFELGYLTTSLNFNICINDFFSRVDFDIQIITPPSRGAVMGSDCDWIYSPNNPNICGPDSLQYELSNPAGSSTAWVYLDAPCRPFSISEGISPNGDGINDVFVVNSLQDYPDHELRIFNRWGNLVFQATDYQNDWNGNFNGRDLPDGTYFYVIALNNERGEVFTGYLIIQR